MMRRHGIDMWIVVNEEFHDDPLTQYIAPPRPYAGGRDIFVFIDAGAERLKKMAATGYVEENVGRFFQSAPQPGPPDKILAELYATYTPAPMFLRTQTVHGRTYLLLVENERVNGKVTQRIRHRFGRGDVLRESGELDAIVAGLGRFSQTPRGAGRPSAGAEPPDTGAADRAGR